MVFTSIMQKFTKSAFVKDVLTLVTGTAFAQLIPFLFYPIVSRLFTPEDFGLYALYFSIVGILDVVATGRYELAIVIPKKDDDAINIIAGSTIFSVIFSILLFFIAIFFKNEIGILLKNTKISKWLYIIPIVMIFISIGKLLSYWLIRKKAFKASAINKITQKTTESIVNISLGGIKFSNGLIIGDFTGRVIVWLVSYYQSVKTGLDIRLISKKSIVLNLKKYKDYPLYNCLPALLNSSASLLPIFMISSYFNEATTGYFNFSRQILLAPLSIISFSISQVLFQQIAEKRNNKQKIFNKIKGLSFRLFALSGIIIIIIFFLGTDLFRVIFGTKWILSGKFTQILVFSYALQFVVSPLSIVLAALGKIRIWSLWQFLYFSGICCLYFFKDLEINNFLVVYVLIDLIFYTMYYLIILGEAIKFDRSLD